MGVLTPNDDEELVQAYTLGLPGAAASPYVVSMNQLRIRVLPHIVNALVLGSASSAGNSFVYCTIRCLYGLALEGKAPKIFAKCTKRGVPIYCVITALAFSLLSFLQINRSAAVVLRWLINLVSQSKFQI